MLQNGERIMAAAWNARESIAALRARKRILNKFVVRE
jgi:hypothetical protein